MAAVTTFEIHAADPAQSIAFYTATLDWTFVEHKFGEVSYWEIATGSEKGATGRLITRMGPGPGAGAPVMGAVITVEVDDIDSTLKKGLAAGATEAMAKFALPGAGWMAYLLDPDHNVFGVFQPDGEAH